ncbi:MAG: hypothetical protein M1831_000107 [Alyxoria varia]|nr:MAG: hypothetical protein M1831_000107 [Alyxoria varia]
MAFETTFSMQDAAELTDQDVAQSEASTTHAHDSNTGAFGRQATQSIAPFLQKHIPSQYSTGVEQVNITQNRSENANTKYCYRHHPDLKCRRQADEPSMDQLQNELSDLPQSDQQGISLVWSLFSAAPSQHRKLMLGGVLAQCCFPQLSFLSAAVRDLIKIDFISALPTELSIRVLCFLDPTSLCKAAQVSTRWRNLADDDVVWHRMCEQHIDRKCEKCGWGLPLLDRKRLRREKRQIQLRATGHYLRDTPTPANGQTPLSTPSATPDDRMTPDKEEQPTASRKRRSSSPIPGSPSKRLCQSTHEKELEALHSKSQLQPWKDVYRDRFKIGTNWKYGRCSVKTFKGHTNGVMCLQFDDNILASGSYDSTIKIWSIETGEELRTLSGHTLGIRCLQYDDSKLASGSLDGTVKLWDLATGNQLCTLSGHTGGVLGLHIEGTLVASGSEDNTVRLWDFKKQSSVVLRGHTDWVNAVKIDRASRTLLSASDDCTIRLWDLDAKKCIKKFEGHVGQVQQVVPLPPEFDYVDPEDVSSSESAETASKFDYDDSSENSENEGRPAPPRFMLTGGLDATIRLWDVHRGICVRTFFGHLEGIWGLAADTLRIVSGAQDGMVKIWDPRNGKCERTFTGHAGPVTCVGLNDKRMCTGSEDHEVRMYSFCA